MKILVIILSSGILIGCGNTLANNSALTSPTIITAILVAVLTTAANNFIKNKEYKYEYYKKVIQMRIEAYKLIEKQIEGLAILSIDKTDDKRFMTVFETVNKMPDTETRTKSELNYLGIKFNDFEILREDIEKALAQRLWVSDEVILILGEIYKKYNEISVEYDIKKPDSLVILGKQYFKTLDGLRIELEKAITKDYKYIHKVPSFLVSKSKSKLIEFSAKPYHY